MKNKFIEELFNIESDEYYFNNTINKKVNKGINLKIIKIVVICLLIIGIIYIGQKGIGYIVDYGQTYYNPRQENKNLGYNDDAYLGFDVLFKTALEMKYSDISLYGGHILENGHGKYIIESHLVKTEKYFKTFPIDNNLKVYLEKSRIQDIEVIGEDILVVKQEQFVNEDMQKNSQYDYRKISQEEIKDIEELPDSSVLEVDISFNKNYTTQEVIDFIKKYDHSLFTWLGIDDFNQSACYGIQFYNMLQNDFNDTVKKKYPNLYIDYEKINTKDFEQYYESQLKLLLDHKDFLNLAPDFLFFSPKEIQSRLDYFYANKIQSIGVTAKVKKQDLLKMINDDKLLYIDINDVKLSPLQK